jgi:uncharacterized YigZ family protein
MPDKAMSSYYVPARETRIEIRVSNSRFIATATPVFHVDEANAFVARIKDEFPDATHNVPAYLVGHGASVTAHCTDDGEPSGTAGRPALAVLQGSGLGDIGVVVTRCFGGTKLGTGGLVRAYGDAVREVLAVLPRAEKVFAHRVAVTIPYALYERVRLAVDACNGQIVGEEFAAQVTLTAHFTEHHLSEFQTMVQELSAGAIQPQTLGTGETILMPVAGDQDGHSEGDSCA